MTLQSRSTLCACGAEVRNGMLVVDGEPVEPQQDGIDDLEIFEATGAARGDYPRRRPAARYLTRLRQRMSALGWDKSCPVYNATRAAELAVEEVLRTIRDADPGKLAESESLGLAGEIIRGLVKRR